MASLNSYCNSFELLTSGFSITIINGLIFLETVSFLHTHRCMWVDFPFIYLLFTSLLLRRIGWYTFKVTVMEQRMEKGLVLWEVPEKYFHLSATSSFCLVKSLNYRQIYVFRCLLVKPPFQFFIGFVWPYSQGCCQKYSYKHLYSWISASGSFVHPRAFQHSYLLLLCLFIGKGDWRRFVSHLP